jgi:Transglycosylase
MVAPTVKGEKTRRRSCTLRAVRIWVAVALGVSVCALGGVLAARPVLRRVLISEAERRGLGLTFSEMRLTAGSVELAGVEVKPKRSSFARASLRKVRLRLSLMAPRLRSVEVLGGKINIQGSVDEVRNHLEEFRRRPSSAGRSPSPQGRFVALRDLELEWRGALGGEEVQALRGLGADLGPGGADWGADWVSLDVPGGTLEVAGVRAHATQGEAGLRVESVSAGEARLRLKSAPEPKVEPTSVGPDNKSASPGLLTQFPLNPSLPGRLQAFRSWLSSSIFPVLPAQSSIKKLWVKYERGGEQLELGPSRLELSGNAAEFQMRFEPGQGATGTPLAAVVTIPRSAGDAKFEIRGGPVSLATLGVQEGSFGLVGLKSAEILGQVEARLSPSELKFRGSFDVTRLGLENARIAKGRVFFPQVHGSGGGRFFLDGSFLELEEGELSLGEAKFTGSVGWRRTAEHAELGLDFRAPMIACQSLLDAAPRGLLGLLEGSRLKGTFGLDLTVDADTRKLSQMAVAFHLKNDCRLESVPPEFSPDRFRGPFVREVPGPGGLPISVETGPTTGNWAPFDSISRYLETALLVTEDGRFHRHRGFDERAIESSIRDNVAAGRFVRGASTISMQLAKNLYLERTKTLSRKLEEALLTMLLEQSFDKRELLELYMNVVELGPGVYGIDQAARYYFGTTPAELSIAQCFFLASLLPAPTRQYFTADGHLTASRRDHIHKLLKIAFDRERLTEGELERALAEEVVFGQTHQSGILPVDEGGLPLRSIPEPGPSRLGEPTRIDAP